jgi:acetyl-CoA carboxylase biotin carboxyl carrier protein
MTERHDVAALIATIDGLESLLERADLSELEVEASGTTIVLRTPSAIAPMTVVAPSASRTAGAAARPAPAADPLDAAVPAMEVKPAAHVVVAPLTGVFYRSPSPGAVPYLREGGPVNAGQVIGLIEAMKLFNEIKSDVSGTVRRLVAGEGALVKARDPLIEVELA